MGNLLSLDAEEAPEAVELAPEGLETELDFYQTNSFFLKYAETYLIAMPCKFVDGSVFWVMIKQKQMIIVYESELGTECKKWIEGVGLSAELLTRRDPVELVKRPVLGEDHVYEIHEPASMQEVVSSFTEYVCDSLKKTHTLMQ